LGRPYLETHLFRLAAVVDSRHDACGLAARQHVVERLRIDLQRNMQVIVVLGLELERRVGRFEKRQLGAISQAVEGMQGLGWPPAFGFLDLQRARQRQAEKVLIKSARLFRVAATVRVAMQSADHDVLLAL